MAIKSFLAVFMAAPFLLADASDRPVGVFDSGTGGLTVLEKLLTVDEFDNDTGVRRSDGKPDLDRESFVYFGDQANMPYGLYSAKGKTGFLRELVIRDTEFVLGADGHAPSKIVVIACNTATAYGLEASTQSAKAKGVKVIGVVNAGVEAAMDALSVKKGMAPFAIGVIATPGTIASGVYGRTLRSELSKRGVDCCDIVSRGGVGLAEAVENDEPGMADCARTNFVAMVESYRLRGGKAPIRAVILGCTHYPFVLPVFRAALSELQKDARYRALLAEDLVFVDPAVYTAVQCYRSLKEDGVLSSNGPVTPRVKAFMSVGRNGPLPESVKYGRSEGLKDIGTDIVPMTKKTMSERAVKRLFELLPVSGREVFGRSGMAK